MIKKGFSITFTVAPTIVQYNLLAQTSTKTATPLPHFCVRAFSGSSWYDESEAFLNIRPLDEVLVFPRVFPGLCLGQRSTVVVRVTKGSQMSPAGDSEVSWMDRIGSDGQATCIYSRVARW
jgi:hypothetical protein